MRVKLLTFKPNKNGDVTLYLGAGVDLRELIDLIGQEVTIELAIGKEEKPVGDNLKEIMAMIQDYGEIKYQRGIDADRLSNSEYIPEDRYGRARALALKNQVNNPDMIKPVSTDLPEPVDVFEFGEGK